MRRPKAMKLRGYGCGVNFLAAAAAVALVALAAISAGAGTCCGKYVRERIYVIPSDGADDKAARALRDGLSAAIPVTSGVETSRARALPAPAYDGPRKQYDASAVIDSISRDITLALTNERAVVMTGADLYVPGADFVYGAADGKKGVAIVSLARLRNEFRGLKPDDRLLRQRALKVALRQLGRSWGMQDCPAAKCVMNGSDRIEDIDRKRETFCYRCSALVERRSDGETLMGPAIRKMT